MLRSSWARFLVALGAGAFAALVLVLATPALFRLTHGLATPAALSPGTRTAALTWTRWHVDHQRGSAAPPAPDANALQEQVRGPVFVTLYAPGLPPDREPATGAWLPTDGATATLADALAAAAAGAAAAFPVGVAGRVKVDLAGPERPAWSAFARYLELVVNPGMDGYALHRGDRSVHFLPSWTVERGWAPARVLQWAAARLGGTDNLSVSRFRTRAYVEGTPDEPGTWEVHRGNVLRAAPGADDVRRALERGAGYLARAVGPDGRYCYNYLAVEDRCDSDYNLLRHAGTTYALYQLHGRLPDPAYLEAAERAAEWLRQQVREVPGDPPRAFLLEGTLAKLGAAGLGLLALVEREKLLGDGRDRALMRRLAEFIRSQQREDGWLASYFRWNPAVDVPPENSIYYPGEAVLGLVRLHDVDPDPRILETAVRSADFLVSRRWRWAGVELFVPVDAWLSQALLDLDVKMPDERWRAYGRALARTFVALQLRADEGAAPDLAGGPAGGALLASSAVAGARNEGMTALRLLSLRAGDAALAASLREAVLASAAFQLNQQYRAVNTWFLPNPARGLGGIRGRPDDPAVRIDHVQHNASGLLRVLDLLEARP